ncbi:hypothetical protein LZC95_50160 [Pendulispora brunnea]|uniref:Mu-like prophage FluMu N-terminal domain-containing protein n=1 Tax=Pendulispora brunnea TaxID=2905690 RepID=A0ABZ2KAG3_9BACT
MSAVRVRVRAFPADGFFRAGRFWPGSALETEVDEDTLKVLEAERNLAVEVLGRSADAGDDDAPRRPSPPPPLPQARRETKPDSPPARSST